MRRFGGMNKVASYSIIANGTHSCSGGCYYCCAANSTGYTLSNYKKTDLDKLKEILIKNDERNYNEAFLDFPALEKALDNDIKLYKNNPDTIHVDYWSADPVTGISVLREVFDFMTDYCQTRNYKLDFHTSTNGLPLIRDDIYEYLKTNNIKFQLSHDGLGQWMRTQDIDPLKDIPNLRDAIKTGLCNWINCTLTFWNYSLLNNMGYYLSIFRELFPTVFTQTPNPDELRIYSNLYVKLNHIYDSTYDIKARNYKGLLNGKVYTQLIDFPIGDLALRNDSELANKTGVHDLAHVLDNYINEYWEMTKYMKGQWIGYKPFKNYILSQLKRNRRFNSHYEKGMGWCRLFQAGKQPNTFVLDTKGRYCQCNLLDSDHQVDNPGGVQPDYCKGCRYEFAEECNGCGSVKFPDKCEYRYAWNSFLDSYNRSYGKGVMVNGNNK